MFLLYAKNLYLLKKLPRSGSTKIVYPVNYTIRIRSLNILKAELLQKSLNEYDLLFLLCTVHMTQNIISGVKSIVKFHRRSFRISIDPFFDKISLLKKKEK